MKKIILFLAILLFAVNVKATEVVTTMTHSGDTITNTGTVYVTITTNYFYELITIQAKATKVSGTVGGYAIPQASIDGTNYLDLSTDTMIMTNVTTNTKVWPFTHNNYLYYRIKYVGIGTMAAKAYGYCQTSRAMNRHVSNSMVSNYSLTSDTIVNSGTGYVGLTASNYYETIGIQCTVTKISGTVGGTVTVQGSIDGTNYVTVSSSFSTAQTLSCTNVTTNTKLFVITGNPYKYYRLNYAGTGTMSATIKGYLLPNR